MTNYRPYSNYRRYRLFIAAAANAEKYSQEQGGYSGFLTGQSLDCPQHPARALHYATMNHLYAAEAAYNAKRATPAPPPKINPTHYPDPISYLNRCRHFKRAMLLMERGADEYAWRQDWSGMTAYSLVRVTTYYTAADAYDNCVAAAMSLSLPYNPLPPGATVGMPF